MKSILLALSVLFCSTVLNAGVLTVFIENDVVADTDRDYTHGTRIEYELDTVPSFINSWLPENTENAFSLSVSQYIYTPDDIKISEFIPESRPYAGWLYLSPMVSVRNENILDTYQVDIGVVGKHSLAEETQKKVHVWMDSDEPMGWDHQIDSEVGVNLVYNRKYKFKLNDWVDFIPTYGGSLGTIHTYFGAGGMVRAGFNLPDDFGLSRIEPTTRENQKLYAYLMCDLYGKYVAHNTFIEGSLFDSDGRITIEKEDFGGEVTSGLVVGNGRMEVGLLYTIRSKEYVEQDNQEDFGSLVLSWKL
jgi:hypothetical protein